MTIKKKTIKKIYLFGNYRVVIKEVYKTITGNI